MTIKTEIIALAVRLVSEKTNIIQKPNEFESLITNVLGGDSYDIRIAKDIEASLNRAMDSAKRMTIDRKFKKITKEM